MNAVQLARPAPDMAIGHAPPVPRVPTQALRTMSGRLAHATAHGLLQAISVVCRLSAVVVLAGLWAVAFAGAIAVGLGFAAGVLILMSSHFN